MKLNQLRQVATIAELGSLRAAARTLNLAQPALTRSIQELEHELGAALFERAARGMIPTQAGEAFVQRARAIMNDVRRAKEEVDQIQGGSSGSLVAGLSIAAHVALLPHSLARFRKRYPGVRIRLIEGFLPTLEGGLKDGSVDFYLGPGPKAAVADGLVAEKLFDNTRVIVCRSGHPLAASGCAKTPRSLADLTGSEWVTTSITHFADDELGVLFARHGLPKPRLVSQIQSALSLIMMICYSDMLAMLPVQFMKFPIKDGALTTIPVKESLPAPPIVLVRRAALPLTPAAEYLVSLLRKRTPAKSS